MYLPIFSKRHKKLVDRKEPFLKLSIASRRRVLYAMQDVNQPVYSTDWDGYNHESDLVSAMGYGLVQEHGWEELKTYDQSQNKLVAADISDFLKGCRGHHVLDAIELYSRKLTKDKQRFQERINHIFIDSSLPWRLADDIIFRIDSEYMAEILQCASGLLMTAGFDGALEEFRKARSRLDTGDTKESIHHANLALESTMKSILGIEREKPGRLISGIINSGIIPSYYGEFLGNFEQVLRSVSIARNEEKGAGHGQGATVEEVPDSLAELVLNLCGALIVYLVKQHVEAKKSTSDRDDV